MALKIYNTLTRKKDEFVPLKGKQVSMYVCGPTVYDHSHIGHGRAAVVFDMIYRCLRGLGYQVTYVRNITDIDDKIINKANQEKLTVDQIAKRYSDSYQEDVRALGTLPPDIEPKATETIAEMIVLVKQLVDKGLAYQGEAGGDVYFAVGAFPNYCGLSGKDLEELRVGARVAVEEKKRDPLDFVLWKMSKPGEPKWDSPWGAGRPGWHIECSAMSRKYLGTTIDIHGGGHDLIFPHHENEIAQSEGVSGKPFVRYWLHNGFVNIDKEKMSKSLGNFFTIKELLKRERAEVLRMFLLSVHYRGPLDFSLEGVSEAKRALDRLYTGLRGVGALPERVKMDKLCKGVEADFCAAIEDDFNSPKALGALFDAIREINRLQAEAGQQKQAQNLAAFVKQTASDFLGLLTEDPTAYFQQQSAGGQIDADQIEKLIGERTLARKNKDFARADAIRKELADQGVVLEDGAAGTTWKWIQ